jgi:hypothetical protein
MYKNTHEKKLIDNISQKWVKECLYQELLYNNDSIFVFGKFLTTDLHVFKMNACVNLDLCFPCEENNKEHGMLRDSSIEEEIFPWITNDNDEEFPNIPWKQRSLENRKFINKYIQSHEEHIADYFLYWFLPDVTGFFKIEKYKLILSENNRPHWNISIKYGPMQTSLIDLQKEIQENFEHYYGAGDYSVNIKKWTWKEIKLSNHKEFYNMLKQQLEMLRLKLENKKPFHSKQYISRLKNDIETVSNIILRL